MSRQHLWLTHGLIDHLIPMDQAMPRTMASVKSDLTRCTRGKRPYRQGWRTPNEQHTVRPTVSPRTFLPPVRMRGAGNHRWPHPSRRIRMRRFGSSKTRGSRNVSTMAATDDSSPLSATCFDTNAKSRVQQASPTARVVGRSSRERRRATGIWHTTSANHGHRIKDTTRPKDRP